jgi:uncharacterized protein
MLQTTAKGIEFSVKVVPHSQKKMIVGWENQHLKIRLHASPERNKANEELIEFLSSVFDLPKADVHILQGHTSRLKKILLTNISLEEANQQLSKNVY